MKWKVNFTISNVFQRIFWGLWWMAHRKSIKECTWAARNLEKVEGNLNNELEGFCHSFHCVPEPPLSFNLSKDVATPHSHPSHKIQSNSERSYKVTENSVQLIQTHQNFAHYLNMPTQSRLLPLDSYSGLDIVPFIAANQVVTFQYILENSPLTMTLRDHHFHSTEDLFSINFKLINALWFILKDLSRTIQLVADPLLDPFSDLLGTLDPKLLKDIDMPFPTILAIENYTQNLLIVMSTWAELKHLFGIAQKIRLAGAQWI